MNKYQRIDINNKIIHSYLKNYTCSINLERDYDDIISYKNKINKFINSKNSKYKGFNLTGGADGTTLTTKLNQIAEVTKIYKSIDITDITKNKQQIETSLNELSKKMSTSSDLISSNNETQYTNKINNTIETLATNVTTMKNGFNVIPEDIKIYLPVDITNLDVPDPSTFIRVIQEYQKIITEFPEATNTTNMQISNQLDQIITYIDANSPIIQEATTTISTALEPLIASNTNFANSLRYEYKSTEISFIIPITELVNRITQLKDENLDINNFYNNYVTRFNSKQIRQNKFVDAYNQMVKKLPENYGLPNPYFNGTYVIRVTNNLLISNDNTQSSLNLLGNLLKTNGSKPIDINAIYNPDFSNLQLGGADYQTTATRLADFNELVKNYGNTLMNYKLNVQIYNANQLHLIMHTLFLTLIATNQLLINGYTIYVFMNKGLLEFFRIILTNINRKIDENDLSEEIAYMRKYHYVTIKKLQSFVTELSNNMNTKDIIDIRACTGNTANMFLLLNYFKTVLESYNVQFQNKITIYSRINDIRFTTSDNSHKMFLSDIQYKRLKGINEPADASTMWIRKNPETCSDFKNAEPDESLKFTQTFDSENFPSNGDISKYMTLDTQLASTTSIAVMTYGYSGTGKTYTLFGNKTTVNEDGLLQFTIDNINGLLKLKFRVYEIFGYGLAYPHYWIGPDGQSRTSDIFNRIYHYNLRVETDSLNIDNITVYGADEIATYTNQTRALETPNSNVPTYIDISSKLSETILKNFDMFVNEIENHRAGLAKKIPETNNKTGKPVDFIRRIRDTPNNVVSSRSVIVYDFQLYVDNLNKPPVPFLIIDLPGREEIIKTYVDTYIDNIVIQSILLTNSQNIPLLGTNPEPINITLYYKFLLALMSLNPLALPLFDPSIYSYVRDKYPEILNKRFALEFYLNTELASQQLVTNILQKYDTQKIDGTTSYRITGIKGENGFKFTDEFINLRGITVENLLSDLQNNRNKGYGYIPIDQNKYQYYALLGIHVMNRLILDNQFDIIQEIYERVIRININDKIRDAINNLSDTNSVIEIIRQLINSRFKGDFTELIRNKTNKRSENFDQLVKDIINDSVDQNKYSADLQNIKIDLIQLLQYDWYLTPFEGIYINENIAGLIKYLASKMIADPKQRDIFVQQHIKRQDTTLNFVYQQKISRMWLMSREPESDIPITKFYDLRDESQVHLRLFNDDGTRLFFNFDNMRVEYDRFKDTYQSDAIFNFDHPLIESILQPYISRIDDYKVFYLFANYADKFLNDMKCKNQYNLLENTKNFVETVSGTI